MKHFQCRPFKVPKHLHHYKMPRIPVWGGCWTRLRKSWKRWRIHTEQIEIIIPDINNGILTIFLIGRTPIKFSESCKINNTLRSHMNVWNNGTDPEWGTLMVAKISDFIIFYGEKDPCVITPSFVCRFLTHWTHFSPIWLSEIMVLTQSGAL